MPAKKILEIERWRRKIHPASLTLAKKWQDRMSRLDTESKKVLEEKIKPSDDADIEKQYQERSRRFKKGIKQLGRVKKIWHLTLVLGGLAGAKKILSPEDFNSLQSYLEEDAFSLLKQDPTGFSWLDRNAEGMGPSYRLGVQAYESLYNAAVEAGIPKDQKF